MFQQMVLPTMKSYCSLIPSSVVPLKEKCRALHTQTTAANWMNVLNIFKPEKNIYEKKIEKETQWRKLFNKKKNRKNERRRRAVSMERILEMTCVSDGQCRKKVKEHITPNKHEYKWAIVTHRTERPATAPFKAENSGALAEANFNKMYLKVASEVKGRVDDSTDAQ